MWIKDTDPGDPKRPDPTGSGSATLPIHIICWFQEIVKLDEQDEYSILPNGSLHLKGKLGNK